MKQTDSSWGSHNTTWEVHPLWHYYRIPF